ncbi:MAG TPA: hypothetical protein VM098_04110 [Phycisphaerae bacterium]|nr:hypothetical protein [Phycisphaerae bacterium]
MRTDIMTAARERAERFGVKNVLVATNTGASVLAARESFGSGYGFFAVGNPASSRERGLVGHDGISDETKSALEEKGIAVVLQDQSLFQADGRSRQGAGLHQVATKAYTNRFLKGRPPCCGAFDIVPILGRVLAEFFGDGPKVCLEIALMAADSGKLPLDVDCIAIATPSSYCDLPDAAMILRPRPTRELFTMQLRIKDLILRPTPNDVWFNNGPLP